MKWFSKPLCNTKYDQSVRMSYITGSSSFYTCDGSEYVLREGYHRPKSKGYKCPYGLPPSVSDSSGFRYVEMQSGFMFVLDGDYALTLAGLNTPCKLTYLNNRWIALTQYDVFESFDKVNWTKRPLPAPLPDTQIRCMARSSSKYIFPEADGYYLFTPSTGAVSATLIKYNEGNTYSAPLGLPYALTGVPRLVSSRGKMLDGFFMEGSRWSSSYELTDKWNSLTIRTVGTKNGYNGFIYERSLAYEFGTMGKFICSEEGTLYYKLCIFSYYTEEEGDVWTGQSVYDSDSAAFSTLVLDTTETIKYVFQYKFNYDYDNYYQARSAYVHFEKYLLFTDTKIYELTLNGEALEATLLPLTPSGAPVLIREEYQCKWEPADYWAGVVVRPEVRRLHIYCEGGSHFTLEASDKTVQPSWASASTGIDLKTAIEFTSSTRADGYIYSPRADVLFQDATGGVYVQKGYGSLLYLCTLPDMFYATRRKRADDANYYSPHIEIYTRSGMYLFHDSKGLAGPLLYTLSSAYNDITFINGKYIYNGYSNKVYFSSDLIAWEYQAKAPNAVAHYNRASWYYLGGYYVSYASNNMFYYLDTDTKTLKPGLSPTVGQPFYTTNSYYSLVSWAQVENKLLAYLGSRYEALTVYEPGVSTTVLVGTPRTMAILTPGIYSMQELSRLTFTITTTGDSITQLIFYGKYYGCRITVNVYPRTGTGDTNPYYAAYGNNIMYKGMTTQVISTGTETHATPGTKTVEVIFEAITAYDIEFDLTLLDITLNDVSIMGPNFDQTVITSGGDPWTINANYPFKRYPQGHPYLKSLLKGDDPSVANTSPNPCLLMHDNAVYLYPDISTTTKPSSTNVYEYNSITHQFELITNVKKATTLMTYAPTSQTRIQAFVELIQGDDRVFKQNATAQFVINGVYPLAKEAKDMAFGPYATCVVVGAEGRVVFFSFTNGAQCIVKLDTTNDLNSVARFNFTQDSAPYTRTVTVGQNGFVAYTDDMFDSWQTAQIGTENLLQVYAEASGTSGKVLAVGNNGGLYYSSNGAESWQKIALGTTENITCIAKSAALSKVVIAGTNSYLAVSTDFTNWTRIYTGLTFSARSATEHLSNIYIGCNNGVLIRSTDLYTWIYQTVNTPLDIERVVSVRDHDPRSDFLNVYTDVLYGQLTQVLEDPSKYFSIGDAAVKHFGSALDLDSVQRFVVSDIQGVYLKLMEDVIINSSHTLVPYSGDVILGKTYTIYDIYATPQIKAYKDANCTLELTGTLYKAAYTSRYGPTGESNTVLVYTLPRNANPTYLDVYFQFNVDVSTIQYVNTWIKTCITELYFNGYSSYERVVDYSLRNITLPVESYNQTDHSVRISGFDFPDDKKGYIVPTVFSSMTDAEGGASYYAQGIIGIPYNSLYMLFTEDQEKAEEVTASIWLKLQDSSKLYDYLTITSRNAFGTYDYIDQSLPPTTTSLHNSRPVMFNPSCSFTMTRCRTALMAEANLYLYAFLIADSDLLRLSEDAFFADHYGLWLTGSNLRLYPEYSASLSNPPDEYGLNGEFWGGANPCGTIELRNKYYENTVWSEWYGQYGANRNEQVFPVKLKNTIVGDVSYTLGDIAGSGFFYLRSVTGGFAPLRSIQGHLFFDAFYFDNTSWEYISDNLIKVKPAVIYANYTIEVFRAVLRTFTGPLHYFVSKAVYDYSSDALQPAYTFSAGQLEFSLDQYPGIKKGIYELPPLDSTTPLKVNVHTSLVNRGALYVPNSIIRISGIEYNL